jgi:hypothetical protein
MRLDELDNPLMLVEEKDGKLIMELATAVPVRDIAKETLEDWIKEDESAAKAVRELRKKSK